MRILVVDDMEDRQAFFKKAYSSLDNVLIPTYCYDSAALEIASTPHKFDMMFLDHDLSIESALCDPNLTIEKTGSDIAEFIVRKIDPTKCVGMKIYCHSMNPIGRKNMLKILLNAGFDAVDAPFYTMKLAVS